MFYYVKNQPKRRNTDNFDFIQKNIFFSVIVYCLLWVTFRVLCGKLLFLSNTKLRSTSLMWKSTKELFPEKKKTGI